MVFLDNKHRPKVHKVALVVFLALSLQSPPQQEDFSVALVEALVLKHRQLLADFSVP